jgi:hypothetical protein
MSVFTGCTGCTFGGTNVCPFSQLCPFILSQLMAARLWEGLSATLMGPRYTSSFNKRIPTKIHQTWKDNKIPWDVQAAQQSWTMLNPEFEWVFVFVFVLLSCIGERT